MGRFEKLKVMNRRPAHRRGSSYLVVLSASSLVFVLAIGAIAVNRAASESARLAADEAEARRLALSAIELAMQSAENTIAWRTQAATGLFSDRVIGRGFASATVTDPLDGILANSVRHPLRFTGVGRAGSARQVLSVRADFDPLYRTCLDGAMHAAGTLTMTSCIVRSDSPIGSNTSVTVSSSTVKSNVYSAGGVSGSGITGTTTTYVTARTMPDPDVIARYVAQATPIAHNALNSGRIHRTLLSGATNPFGAVNPRGIYSIDCGGNSLEIQDSRITGTLIVTNTSGVSITNSVYWSEWEEGLPILLVSGNLAITTAALDLIESSFRNFNPTGNPYKGVTDSDTLDRYPSILEGLIHATGSVTLGQRVRVVGALVAGGGISVNSGAIVALHRRVIGSPAGFVDRSLRVDSTTFSRGVD